MLHYQLYGLHTVSAIVLPELLPWSLAVAADIAGEPDLSIVLGPVPEHGLPDGQALDDYTHIDGEQFWLRIEGVARYLVSAGKCITIEPELVAGTSIDQATIRLFLLGSCLGALMFQRGWLVLHGNAIRIGDECIICVGDSGAGKSTLAAAFLAMGHQIISDDVAAIDEQGRIIPGFPRIKLWQDAADKLGLSTAGLERITPEHAKFNYPLVAQFCETRLPVRHVYFLDPQPQTELTLELLHGKESFRLLRDHTYRLHFLASPAAKIRHLQQTAELANTVRSLRLSRPEQGCDLGELVRFILADIQAH